MSPAMEYAFSLDLLLFDLVFSLPPDRRLLSGQACHGYVISLNLLLYTGKLHTIMTLRSMLVYTVNLTHCGYFS